MAKEGMQNPLDVKYGICTVVSCAAALVGHVIHVFVSNAFLGEHIIIYTI